MMPKSYEPLEAVFKSMVKYPNLFSNTEFHFIGTGKTPDDAHGYNIKALAEKYDLWQSVVFEYPKRIPYLDVLVHLSAADGIFILGSTEAHYTPSKTYQGVLSGKALLAILHKDSTAVNVIRQSGAGMVLSFNGEKEIDIITNQFASCFKEFSVMQSSFDATTVNMDVFENYSAKNTTKKLVDLLNQALVKKTVYGK